MWFRRKCLFRLALVVVMFAMPPAATFAQPTAFDTVTATKWLEAPTVDGQCNDPAYSQAGVAEMFDPNGQRLTGGRLIHSGVDLYVCFADIPMGANQVIVRVAGADKERRGSLPHPGDYEFGVELSGSARASRANHVAEFVPLDVEPGQFAAVVQASDPNQLWSAELRIRLDWLGGYGRTDGLYLAARQPDGAVAQQWPGSANPRAPETWGDLVLAPAYGNQVSAGSAFVDGQGGYLVVPYAPELNPEELTIQAWVRIVDGSCGPLLSHGGPSYWLGLCTVLRFGHAGATTATGGQIELPDGWHHVAVTMDREGVRTLYVDGRVDVQPGLKDEEWPVQPERLPEHHARLGRSEQPLRIGGDPDGAPGETSLHGYVRDLTLWNRVLSQEDIRRTALQRPHPQEPGLVALWPFTDGLRDIAGGHHAGQIGNASLARETAAVPTLAPLPFFPPLNASTPLSASSVPAFDGRLPVTDAEIILDGSCLTREYAGAAQVALEPERLVIVNMVLRSDGLYLCTPRIAGGTGASDGLTLWVDSAAQGDPAPGPTALRVKLVPGGGVVAGTGDGNGYGGPAPPNIDARVVAGTEFHLQEDQRGFSVPHWSGEMRIPLSALAPFTIGGSLRFALQYQGTIPADFLDGAQQDATLSVAWPAQFNPYQLSTWAPLASAAPADTILPRPLDFAGRTAPAIQRPPSLPEVRSGTPHHRLTEDDFLAVCGPEDPPPKTPERIWLGLRRMANHSMKWRVVDPWSTLQWAEGTLNELSMSDTDSAGVHNTHDLDMTLDLREDLRWLRKGAAAGPQAMEIESLGLPPNHESDVNARPSPGDHVTTLGRWVFDCSHGHTELHPLFIVESDREEIRPTGLPGAKLNAVRVARVWFNSNPDPYNAIIFPASFDFTVKLPKKAGDTSYDQMSFLRVASGDPSKVTANRTDDSVRVSVVPPASTGVHFFEIVVGYLARHKQNAPGADQVYTVMFDNIDVVDDAGYFGNPYSPRWTLDANVNGTWRPIFFRSPVDDTIDAPGYGIGTSFTTAGPNLTIQMIGYQGDTLFDDATLWATDTKINTGLWHLGPLAKLVGAQKLCRSTSDGLPNADPGCSQWKTSDWVLYYRVVPYGEVPPLIGEPSYWGPRVADEPNNLSPTALGSGAPIHVGAAGTATEIHHPAYITEKGVRLGQTQMLGDDTDKYVFATDDFADVEFGPMPAGLNRQVVKRWSAWPPPPPELQELLGYLGADIRVASDSGAVGDVPYDLHLTVKWRDLPPDWGEGMDDCVGKLATCLGRLADLATPATAAEETRQVISIHKIHFDAHRERTLEMDWAWLHTVGDLDYYEITFPPARGRPPGQPECIWDEQPSLTVSAPGMQIGGRAPDVDGFESIQIDDAKVLASGQYVTTIRSATGRRALYRLTATWVSETYLTPEQCKRKTEWQKHLLGELPSAPFPDSLIEKGRLATWKPKRPGGEPPGPWSDSLRLYPLGTLVPLAVEEESEVNAVISSPPGQPVVARLYDRNNVLLAESGDLDTAEPVTARIPAGLSPQAQVTAGGLTAGAVYLLQIVPVGENKGGSAPTGRVGISHR